MRMFYWVECIKPLRSGQFNGPLYFPHNKDAIIPTRKTRLYRASRPDIRLSLAIFLVPRCFQVGITIFIAAHPLSRGNPNSMRKILKMG